MLIKWFISACGYLQHQLSYVTIATRAQWMDGCVSKMHNAAAQQKSQNSFYLLCLYMAGSETSIAHIPQPQDTLKHA